jgi:glycerol-3-phosphate cytidylyltransferase
MCAIVFINKTNNQIYDVTSDINLNKNIDTNFINILLNNSSSNSFMENYVIILNGKITNLIELSNGIEITEKDLLVKLYHENKDMFLNNILPKIKGSFSFLLLDKQLNKIFVVGNILGVNAEKLLPENSIYLNKKGFIFPSQDINNIQIRKLVLKILGQGYINKYNLFDTEYILTQILNECIDMKYIIFNIINIEIFIQLIIENISLEKVKDFILNPNFIIGYTCGVYDLFHVGHVNILKMAKKQCDFLIVGVTTDEKVKYKGKTALIKENDRKTIVSSIKYVDTTIFQENHDKFKAWEKLKFDVLIVGDDWKGHENWIKWEKQLNDVGARIHYESYTKGISSTQLRNKLKK